jgi:hypothetical protein
MLALERWRSESLCPLCGMPKEICHAPYGTYVYGTDDPIRCNVRTALRAAQKGRTDAELLVWTPTAKPWGTPAS